jgi:hypothetical protein
LTFVVLNIQKIGGPSQDFLLADTGKNFVSDAKQNF